MSIEIIAHRGATAVFPENTIPAFLEAVRIGADAIELDVHLTKDGQVIVVHDATIQHATLGKQAVRKLDSGQLSLHAVGEGYTLPTLNAVFDAMHKSANGKNPRIYIELKGRNTSLPPKVIECIRQACTSGAYTTDDFCVIGFSVKFLRTIKDALPGVHIGLSCFPLPGMYALYVQKARLCGAEMLNPHHKLITTRMISYFKRHSLALNAWPVNDEATMDRMVSLRIPHVMTDYPDIFRSRLKG